MSEPAPGTRLTLVRHGEQERPRHPGDADCPLSLRGLEQSQAAVRMLRRLGPFQVLYSSPFARARQTAAPAASALGLEPKLEPGLREFLLVPEGAADEKAMNRSWALARDHWDQAPEGGESVVQFHGRVAATLDRLAASHGGEHVLAFCHGGVIKMAFLHLMGFPLERARNLPIQIDHAGVFLWERVEGRAGGPGAWKLLGANLRAT